MLCDAVKSSKTVAAMVQKSQLKLQDKEKKIVTRMLLLIGILRGKGVGGKTIMIRERRGG